MKSICIVMAILTSVTIVMLLSLTVPNSLFATASKSFCYDKVAGSHHCFETEKKCKQVQKHDERAESPCYIDLVKI
jgi:hypothetical protein